MPAARRAPRRRQPAALPLLALRPAALSALALLVAACRGRAPEPAHPATPRPLPPTAPAPVTDADLAYLRGRALAMPVAGARAVRVPPSFTEPRSGGRVHEAVDIMAPRGTPVLAADDGAVWRIKSNALGGLTVYATDPLERWVYYYAHLDRYHPGLFEGQAALPRRHARLRGHHGQRPARRAAPALSRCRAWRATASGGAARRWTRSLPPGRRAGAGAHRRADAARAVAARPRPAAPAGVPVADSIGDPLNPPSVMTTKRTPLTPDVFLVCVQPFAGAAGG
jgi:hypothetical protein